MILRLLFYNKNAAQHSFKTLAPTCSPPSVVCCTVLPSPDFSLYLLLSFFSIPISPLTILLYNMHLCFNSLKIQKLYPPSLIPPPPPRITQTTLPIALIRGTMCSQPHLLTAGAALQTAACVSAAT